MPTLLRQEDGGKEIGFETGECDPYRFMALMVTYYGQVEQLEVLPYTREVFEWLKVHNIRVGFNTGFPNRITQVIMKRMRWQAGALYNTKNDAQRQDP